MYMILSDCGETITLNTSLTGNIFVDVLYQTYHVHSSDAHNYMDTFVEYNILCWCDQW